MKFPSLSFRKCFILLITIFLVQGIEETDGEPVQKLSNGESPRAFITQKIDTHDVMVFARSYGPHNRQAKDLLRRMSKALNVDVEFLDIDLLPGWDGTLIMTELQEVTGQWSFPNIFIGKKHIGGNQELDQRHALGELEDMIKEASMGQEL
eukprot:jgi/Psemu1/253341/estExt_Genewise1Plus.C_670102